VERAGAEAPAQAPPTAAAAGRQQVATRIVTGVGIALVAVGCFLAGSVPTLVLSTLVVTLAAAECFAALQRGGYRPATLLGLVAVPLAVVLAYLKGPTALLVVTTVFVMAAIVWYLAGMSRADPLMSFGATVAAFTWVGLLGAFAGLLLTPRFFPHRHGIAYLVGTVALAVANDVGAFAVGSRLGRHKVLPRVSPGKSWEGIAGGTVVTLLVAALVISHFHPWDLRRALALGVLVCVLAPLGDLGESQFKRSLGLKDMGSLLPAHGGVLDRIDGFLFVLPAAWLLVRALHLG
jgi:phosphatidate cytidylyltransferase